MLRHQQHIAHRQQGFTLIELLIAVVIVAIGLLGHAALQIQSVNTAHQARFAQTANVAMLDLVQRFSAMPEATINNEFNFSNLADGSAPDDMDCLTSACSRSNFAKYEIREWFMSHKVYIPQLRFSVQHVSNLVTVKMTWDANLSGVGAEDCTADASGNAHQCSEVAVWVR
ncbi:type IV pilus modification protein PilV [Agarivorans sp. Toyoura001]|uniref:type IV pilus modification protein PilV n=1 Tax=unclassified Agarivorans TaxID=2636026 RepID=UPI0010EAE9A4|nr:type IV pilus modification protein PilV [Agarivorans sp. Toyoura001]GDY26293.1 hypothetical protein AHAT_21830 [Agarivorans sp. Toyoura001]